MSGALLFLFVFVGVGATALRMWLFFRRHRSRVQPASTSYPHGAQPATGPTPPTTVNLRARTQPAKVAASGQSDDPMPACADVPAATTPAATDAAEVPEDSRPLNAKESASANRSAHPEVPDQAAEANSSDDGNDACASAPITAASMVPGANEVLDNSSPADAEEAMLGADGHAGVPLAAEQPGAEAGAAASLLPQMAVPGIATSSGVPERNAYSAAAPAEDELFGQGGHVTEDRAAKVATGAPLAAAGAGGPGVVNTNGADDTALLTADCDAAPAGDLAAANAENGHLPLQEAAALAAVLQPGVESESADSATDAAALSGPTEQPGLGAVPTARPLPLKPAQHRDRRGQRRATQPQPRTGPKADYSEAAAALRAPAEARLRLMIHPVRRTVSISAVLARPAGYPDSINLLLGAGTEVGPYGHDRYDDVDLEWTPNLLSGEVRLDSKEGYQWLRSSRRIHIFCEQADEQGLMSVGSVTLNSACAVVCAREDAEAVQSAAAACGSPKLVSHDRWSGVPEGWAVLSGYRPAHAAPVPLDPYLTTLDPGVGAEISLSGGVQVRSGSFAQGSPPRIEIRPFPAGAQVTIDGMRADMDGDGSWRATGWDGPGDHLVDIVPGPSLTYHIVCDPWTEGGWEYWDAHPGRFLAPSDAPWARAQICGASVSGPSGEHVVVAEPMSSVIALGLRRGVTMLRVRPDAPIAVGLLREIPAFLISSSGPRRIQGRVNWLDPPAEKYISRVIDLSWVAAVRSAASRRLPLIADSQAGQEAWCRARARARRHRKAGA